MRETRAVGHMPGLDVRIEHREAPDERAEYLSIHLRATPDFEHVARWLDPFALTGRADPFMMRPFFEWQRECVRLMMRPWLASMQGFGRPPSALLDKPGRGEERS